MMLREMVWRRSGGVFMKIVDVFYFRGLKKQRLLVWGLIWLVVWVLLSPVSGPGGVLAGLARRTEKSWVVRSFEEFAHVLA